MTTSKAKYLTITLGIFLKGSMLYFARYISLTFQLFISILGKQSPGLAQLMVMPRSASTLPINGLNSFFE